MNIYSGMLIGHKLLLQLLGYLLLSCYLPGCAPVVPFSVNTSIPKIPDYLLSEFEKENKSLILAIPVWKTWEGHIKEGQHRYYNTVIDSGFVLQPEQVSIIHEVIPSRTSYGLTGLASAYAVENHFIGMYMISGNGNVTLLLPENRSWKVILHARVDEEWKSSLITTFRDVKTRNVFKEKEGSFWMSRYTIPCEYFTKAKSIPGEWCKGDVAGWFPRQPIEINMDERNREEIVEFINAINPVLNNNEKAKWTQRDIY